MIKTILMNQIPVICGGICYWATNQIAFLIIGMCVSLYLDFKNKPSDAEKKK